MVQKVPSRVSGSESLSHTHFQHVEEGEQAEKGCVKKVHLSDPIKYFLELFALTSLLYLPLTSLVARLRLILLLAVLRLFSLLTLGSSFWHIRSA